MIYSNPRTAATFTDWPSGSHRTTATFQIETKPGKGQRCTRVTLHPLTGRPSAPKLATYARQVRIVDGDDGRTYVAELTEYGSIHVRQSNLRYTHEHVHAGEPRYLAMLELFT